MLNSVDNVRKQIAGRHPAIDAWLNVRRDLIVNFMQIAGLSLHSVKTPAQPLSISLPNFCDQLIDYLSAGHFEIYELLIGAYENAEGRHLSLSNRIIDRIQETTEKILDFNEKYGSSEEKDFSSLDTDLSELGLILEERFKWEDKLVLVLNILDEPVTQQTKIPA